jgi:hypothetical protein
MPIKNWHECKGVNKRTGKVKAGWKAVKGRCPVPTHHTPTISDLVTPGASTAASLGRARRRRGLAGARKRSKKSDRLREQEHPVVVGYELDRGSLTPVRVAIDTSAPGDYGADPMGDGTFRMIPSGDIVSFEERNRRLAKFQRR